MNTFSICAFPLCVGTFPLCVGTFPLCVGTFPLCGGTFPLCIGTFPLCVGTFPLCGGRICCAPHLLGCAENQRGRFGGNWKKGGFERSCDFCLSQHPSSIGCIHSAIFKFCLILLPMAGWCPALHSCGNPEFNQKLEGKHCQAVFKF